MHAGGCRSGAPPRRRRARTLRRVPLSQVANRLEQEVLVSSVFGTNTIEGGTLSEEETASALTLDPRQVQAVEQQRALNIKAAYDLSQAAAKTPGWSLTTEFIVDLHRLITADIPHEDNRPGLIRDNPKTRVTMSATPRMAAATSRRNTARTSNVCSLR
jgi:Fic family protein